MAFDFGPDRCVAIAVAGNDLEVDRCGSTAVFVSSACPVERKPGEPHRGKLACNGGLDARAVERLANLYYANGAVGMQIAPAQHRRLKQVEPTAHERRWAKARVLPLRGQRSSASHKRGGPIILRRESRVALRCTNASSR
ncbi:MAG: hypothetical protein E6H48_00565 [Betaproteobacteria bacterium]|nr:MAG: hypothetical protein E6H48_00565 [Betaproteobacteria bacterium]